MSQQPDAPPDNRPPGGFLVVVGTAALIASRLQSTRSLVTAHDPGPWFLPLGLAVILLLGGIGIFWRSWRTVTSSAKTDIDSPATKVRGWFLAGLAAYLLTLPWLGFLAGTALFITALLWMLKVTWWRALLAGLILTFTAFAIFGWGFNVQLPAGFGN
jgi:hypothetical protein